MSLAVEEVNYTPSRWSARFGETELLNHFVQFSQDVTQNARKSIECQLDIPYGNTERTKYDVYGTDLPKDAPIFVFIHGGYWIEFSKDTSAYPVPVLVANGIKVIVVGYDLCPNVKLHDIVTETKAAIAQILKNALESGNRNVWVGGHSAGAHLAASLMHDTLWLDEMTKQGYLNLLKGIVLIGGLYKLAPMLRLSFNEILKLSKEEVDRYSFSVGNDEGRKPIPGLKVLVATCECDSPTFINESREYAQKLVSVVDNVQYVLLRDKVDHFDIVEKLVDPKFFLTKLILDNILS